MSGAGAPTVVVDGTGLTIVIIAVIVVDRGGNSSGGNCGDRSSGGDCGDGSSDLGR